MVGGSVGRWVGQGETLLVNCGERRQLIATVPRTDDQYLAIIRYYPTPRATATAISHSGWLILPACDEVLTAGSACSSNDIARRWSVR